MAHAKEHIQALLKLPAEDRARAAKLLLDSLDQPPSVVAKWTADDSLVPKLTRSDADHGGPESDDELADLVDLAADPEGLRAAVRAAVETELEPLHELTNLLRRFAELARTTGHALRARTA